PGTISTSRSENACANRATGSCWRFSNHSFCVCRSAGSATSPSRKADSLPVRTARARDLSTLSSSAVTLASLLAAYGAELPPPTLQPPSVAPRTTSAVATPSQFRLAPRVRIDQGLVWGRGGQFCRHAPGHGRAGEADPVEDRGALGVLEELLRDAVQLHRCGYAGTGDGLQDAGADPSDDSVVLHDR